MTNYESLAAGISAEYDPYRKAYGAKTAAARESIGFDYDALVKQLREEAVKGGKSMKEQFNTLGLLQSGMTAAGLGAIETTTQEGVTKAGIDRAVKMADLALEEAGFESGLQEKIGGRVQDIIDKMTAKRTGGGGRSGGGTAKASASDKKLAQLNADLQQAINNSAYFLPGGAYSRESLIRTLVKNYGDIVDPIEIAEMVYRNIRGAKEKPFSNTDANWKKIVANFSKGKF